MLSRIRALLAVLFRRSDFERDMADELRAHLEARVDDLVSSGVSRDAAERRARVEFGAVESYKERCRESRGLRFFDDLRSDVIFFLRSVRKNVLLSAVVIVTLTLAIGMDTGVFTMVNAIALRAEVDNPETFLHVFTEYAENQSFRGRGGPATLSDYVAYRAGSRSIKELAAWSIVYVTLGGDEAGDVSAVLTSCNFFAVYGVQPKLGTLFSPDHCGQPGAAPIVVLSEETWRARFAADPSIVGKTMPINQQPFTVIGVTPAGSSGRFNGAGLWIPYTMQPILSKGPNLFQPNDTAWLRLAGRLSPGASRRDAEAELNVLATQQDRLHPARKTAITVTDGSWFQEPGMREIAIWNLPLIMGALTLVLLIACANVTTLLLSRAAARRHEISVRLALGAARSRLLRMLLTESFLLAILAGVCSLFIAQGVTSLLERFFQQSGRYRLTPDWRVFTYTCVVALLAGCASGLAPAFESLKVELSSSIRGIGTIFGDSVRSGSRLRNLLVGAQVAMSLVLLAGAGVFVRTHHRLVTMNPGFETKQALWVRMLPRNRSQSNPRWGEFHNTIAGRVEALPGVQSVAFSQMPPFVSQGTVTIKMPGQPSRQVLSNSVSPRFFETLSIPIVQGRGFSEADADVAVVSETCARTLWPSENPVGKRMDTPGGQLEVIGVARDVTSVGYGSLDGPLIYPLWKKESRLYFMLVRFSGAPQSTERAVWVALRREAPDMMIVPQTIQGLIDRQVEGFGRMMTLILILAAVALVLATTGIYGVVAFAAIRRTKELGIRAALGASRTDIILEMLSSGAKPIGGGLLIGLLMTLGASVLLARALARAPFPVETRDPVTYGAVVLVLATTALIAILVPARRAAAADPLKALRQD